MASQKVRPPLPEGPFVVVGLARSGQAAARVLAARGAEVVGADAGSPPGAERLSEAGVEVHLDGDLEADHERLADRAAGGGCVVKSPGVPRESPLVRRALTLGIPVIGELELAWRLLPNRFVAVTGTNGKTTVVELLGHIGRAAGEPVAVAGNVGTPLASLVGEVDPEATVICECSSFQLEDAEAFSPEVAVLLNITPDHLDRHRDFDDYAEAKLRIFANQAPGDWAIFDSREPALADQAKYRVGGRARLVDLADSPIEGLENRVAGSALIGPHNARNARAAAAAAMAIGIDRETIGRAIETFPGVPHRLERVAEVAGVAYFNDSKATNPAAAAAALRSFEGGVRAILGGSLKGGGFEELAEPVRERCAAAYVTGPAAGPIEAALAGTGVEVRRCDDLAAALRAAAADAKPGETVLLAPAAASFDAYRDYEERGEHFRALVEELEA